MNVEAKDDGIGVTAATALLNEASSFSHLNDAKALDLFEQALAIMRRVLPADHPEIAKAFAAASNCCSELARVLVPAYERMIAEKQRRMAETDVAVLPPLEFGRMLSSIYYAEVSSHGYDRCQFSRNVRCLAKSKLELALKFQNLKLQLDTNETMEGLRKEAKIQAKGGGKEAPKETSTAPDGETSESATAQGKSGINKGVVMKVYECLLREKHMFEWEPPVPRSLLESVRIAADRADINIPVPDEINLDELHGNWNEDSIFSIENTLGNMPYFVRNPDNLARIMQALSQMNTEDLHKETTKRKMCTKDDLKRIYSKVTCRFELDMDDFAKLKKELEKEGPEHADFLAMKVLFENEYWEIDFRDSAVRSVLDAASYEVWIKSAKTSMLYWGVDIKSFEQLMLTKFQEHSSFEMKKDLILLSCINKLRTKILASRKLSTQIQHLQPDFDSNSVSSALCLDRDFQILCLLEVFCIISIRDNIMSTTELPSSKALKQSMKCRSVSLAAKHLQEVLLEAESIFLQSHRQGTETAQFFESLHALDFKIVSLRDKIRRTKFVDKIGIEVDGNASGGIHDKVNICIGDVVKKQRFLGQRPRFCREWEDTGQCSRGDDCWNKAGHTEQSRGTRRTYAPIPAPLSDIGDSDSERGGKAASEPRHADSDKQLDTISEKFFGWMTDGTKEGDGSWGQRVSFGGAADAMVLIPRQSTDDAVKKQNPRPRFCREWEDTGQCSRGDDCWNKAGHTEQSRGQSSRRCGIVVGIQIREGEKTAITVRWENGDLGTHDSAELRLREELDDLKLFENSLNELQKIFMSSGQKLKQDPHIEAITLAFGRNPWKYTFLHNVDEFFWATLPKFSYFELFDSLRRGKITAGHQTF
jgi:hypothetical protein